MGGNCHPPRSGQRAKSARRSGKCIASPCHPAAFSVGDETHNETKKKKKGRLVYLHDERGHGFAELAAGLHDAQAQRYDLSVEQKFDNRRFIRLNKERKKERKKEKRKKKKTDMKCFSDCIFFLCRSSQTLTRAPMTPRLVRRRYSNGRVLLFVLRKGYRYSGMCAAQIQA